MATIVMERDRGDVSVGHGVEDTPLLHFYAPRLRARREALRLSQSYVAQRVGVSRWAIGRFEQGVQDLEFSQVVRYACVVDYPLHLLVPVPLPGVLGELWDLLLQASTETHLAYRDLLKLSPARARRPRLPHS
jgi:transcriptional regulator with XRE-family HTH domain